MRAASEDLSELPGVVADIGFVGAVDRGLDDDCRGAVARAGRAALDKALQIFGEPGHVEGAVLHTDIDVVGPGAGILAALGAAQHMAGMGAEVIDRLVLRQELDRAVDTACHCRPFLRAMSDHTESWTGSTFSPSPPSGGGEGKNGGAIGGDRT